MNDTDKVLTYEEAKQLCMKAFDGGALYGCSMRYRVYATECDWEHWLKKNESLFKPKPTVEDVLREFADGIKNQNADFTELAIAEYAKRLQLAEGDDNE